MGPSAVRLAGLNAKLESLGYTVEDLGNVLVAQQENTPTGRENAKYLPQIAKTCESLAAKVEAIQKDGKFPLVLGGDRHEYTRFQPERKRARDAAGVLRGPRPT
jgi:arginase